MAQITTKRKVTYMKPAKETSTFSKNSKFILALHSSTDQLGVGLIHLSNDTESIQSYIFPLGRNLSSHLFKSIEALLPSKFWSQIVRIAVAPISARFAQNGRCI